MKASANMAGKLAKRPERLKGSIVLSQVSTGIERALTIISAMISAPASSPGLIAAIHYRLKKRWGPALEANVKETRDKLLSLEEGRPTDSPHSFGDETYEVKISKRHSRLPDEGLLRQVLANNRLAPENVFDQVVSQVLNETKLANLVALGKLTEREVNACRVELSTSLTVEKI